MTELFTRHGTAHKAHGTTEEGRPYFVQTRVCSRCGGLGGGDQWKHTGWTCYQCGGSGKGGTETVKLYTTDELAKLNATAAKRAAKKQAAAEAAAAVAKAEAAARAEAYYAQHGALISRAEQFAERSTFIKDVLRKAGEKCLLTDAQAEALAASVARIEASDARKAASGYVGQTGERLTLTLTAERIASFDTQFGVTHIVTMRDEAGNCIVSKGKFVPPNATCQRDEWDERRWTINGDTFTVKATVKGHDVYRDEKQTVVQRVALVEAKQEQSE